MLIRSIACPIFLLFVSVRAKVHIIGYANKVTRGLCCTTAAAVHHGWSPEWTEHVGGKHIGGSNNGKGAFWATELKGRFSDNDIVWVVDTFDLLVQQPPHFVEQVYLRLEAKHGRRGVIIASAEKNCWPFYTDTFRKICPQFAVSNCEEIIPKNRTYLLNKPTQFYFLNSGSIVTRGSSIAKLVDYMENFKEDYPRLCTVEDQGYLSAAFRFQHKYNLDIVIRLDHDALITASGYQTCDKRFGEFELVRSESQVNAKWRYKVNGAIPAAIHFNGGKGCMADFFDKANLPTNQERTFLWDGKPKQLRDWCGSVACQFNKDHSSWVIESPTVV